MLGEDDALLDAADLLLDEPDLAPLVPAELRREAEHRRQERRERAEREEQEGREERLREERERQAEADAQRRAREGEALRLEEERRRHADAWFLDHAYGICRRNAYIAFGAPKGAHWSQEPENLPFVCDWPSARPAWWAPPPGLLEAVKRYVPSPNGCVVGPEPDWGEWIPRYVPGRPWPWRRDA
jgi:hypothetical protein